MKTEKEEEGKRNLNIYVSESIFSKLKEAACEHGVAFSRLALAILKEKMAADTLTPLEKAMLSLLNDE